MHLVEGPDWILTLEHVFLIAGEPTRRVRQYKIIVDMRKERRPHRPLCSGRPTKVEHFLSVYRLTHIIIAIENISDAERHPKEVKPAFNSGFYF